MDLALCATLAWAETVALAACGRPATVTSVLAMLSLPRWSAQFWILLVLQYLALKSYRVFLYPKFFSPWRRLPGPRDGHFFFGQFLNELRAASPVALWVQWMRENPEAPFIRYLSFGNSEVLIANSLAAHREILQTQCYAFQKSRWWQRLTRELSGPSIVALEFDEHRKHRRVINGAFSPANMRKLEPVFKEKAEAFCRLLEDALADGRGDTGVLTDVVPLFAKATLDVLGVAVLGVELNHLRPDLALERATAGNTGGGPLPSSTTFHAVFQQLFGPDSLGQVLVFCNAYVPTRWIPIQANLTFKRCIAWLNQTLTELVKDRRRELAGLDSDTAKTDTRDLLSFLTEHTLAAGPGDAIPEERIIADIMSFMGAGNDTTAMAIGWSLHSMVHHPATQTALREELAALYASQADVTCADINALPYLSMFVKEVLRLYPPANAMHRETVRPVVVDGLRLPRGTNVVVPPACVHLNPRLWGADAHEFRPERWGDCQQDQTSPFAFAAFGNGPRICPGKAIALGMIKTILAALVRGYRFTAIEGAFRVENPSINLRPAGLNVRFEKIM